MQERYHGGMQEPHVIIAPSLWHEMLMHPTPVVCRCSVCKTMTVRGGSYGKLATLLLEDRQPRLCTRILTLHVVKITGVVLALVVIRR